jgi:hypothetical protein
MSQLRHPWLLTGLLSLASVLTAGCNLSSLAYYLTGGDTRQPAGDMALVPEDKKKEIKVAILAYTSMDTAPELVTVDRELSGLLTRQLQQGSKDNDQKITIVPAAKVQEFKNSHPDWHTMKLADLGKQFQVDYVIYLGLKSLSLYEKGSAKQLYRGRAEITVILVNMNHPDDDPIEKEYSCEYPRARGPIPVDDQNSREFYLAFMNYIAKHLSWYFMPHEFQEDVCD